jgi:hypothetical protein
MTQQQPPSDTSDFDAYLYSPAEQILAGFAIGLAGAVIGKFLGLGRVRYFNRASRSAVDLRYRQRRQDGAKKGRNFP